MNGQSKLGRFLRRERDGVRFCALFALFAVFAVLAFALLYASQNVLVAPLNGHLAWVTEKLLRLFGVQTSSSGPVVVLGSFAVEIKNNCNAVYLGLLAFGW